MPSQGAFTVSGDLILFGSLMNYTAWDENVGTEIAICYGTGGRIGEAQLLGCLYTTD